MSRYIIYYLHVWNNFRVFSNKKNRKQWWFKGSLIHYAAYFPNVFRHQWSFSDHTLRIQTPPIGLDSGKSRTLRTYKRIHHGMIGTPAGVETHHHCHTTSAKRGNLMLFKTVGTIKTRFNETNWCHAKGLTFKRVMFGNLSKFEGAKWVSGTIPKICQVKRLESYETKTRLQKMT